MKTLVCRNPLKSGQGFNRRKNEKITFWGPESRNPLKSGQGFNPVKEIEELKDMS